MVLVKLLKTKGGREIIPFLGDENNELINILDLK